MDMQGRRISGCAHQAKGLAETDLLTGGKPVCEVSQVCVARVNAVAMIDQHLASKTGLSANLQDPARRCGIDRHGGAGLQVDPFMHAPKPATEPGGHTGAIGRCGGQDDIVDDDQRIIAQDPPRPVRIGPVRERGCASVEIIVRLKWPLCGAGACRSLARCGYD